MRNVYQDVNVIIRPTFDSHIYKKATPIDILELLPSLPILYYSFSLFDKIFGGTYKQKIIKKIKTNFFSA